MRCGWKKYTDKEDRRKIRRQIKCFWTWPFGHCWHSLSMAASTRCCNCKIYKRIFFCGL